MSRGYNEKGEYVKTIGSKGTGSGQIDEPSAIAVDSSEYLGGGL